LFAYNNTNLFCRARPACTLKRGRQKFSGGEDYYDGLDQFLFAALYVVRIVRRSSARVNWSACALLRKSLQNFLTFSSQSSPPLPASAVLKNVPLYAKRASKFYL